VPAAAVVLTSLEQVLAIHKEVQGVLLWELDALADDVVEVVGGQVIGHEIPTSENRVR
jgi:hypothetical protein